MGAKKFHQYLMIAFIAGLALSVFLLRYANNWLTESSKELTSLRSEVVALEKKRTDLENAQHTLAKETIAIETLAKVVPDDKDQARIISELYQIATVAGVTIESVGFPASTLGSEVAKPAPATQTTDANSAQTSQAQTPAPQTTVSQATPVKEIAGLQSIDLTLGAINSIGMPSGSGIRFGELMNFLKLVERNKRTIQIKSLGINKGTNASGEESYNLDVTLTIFIRP